MVTLGELMAPRRVRKPARKGVLGQNEAPDHGGTTGGFATAGRLLMPHIENVRPVRALGQAELKHLAKFKRKALHNFTT